MFCTHDNSFKSLQTAAYIAVDKLKNLNLCSFVPLCSFFPSNSTTLCGSSATINQDCLMLILPFERVSCDSKKACILLHISFIYIFIVRGWHLSFFYFFTSIREILRSSITVSFSLSVIHNVHVWSSECWLQWCKV